MALPTGSGSELLKRVTTTGDHSSVQTILTVPTLHIYTILSVIITETAENGEIFKLYMTDADNSNRIIYLTFLTSLLGSETFVFNDKFVLYPADTLKLISSTTSDLDVLVSYIDQDWT
jgi:hypothetical protein